MSATQVATPGPAQAPEGAAIRIGWRHVLGASQERADPSSELRLTTDRNSVEGSAVEGIPHRDRLVAAGGDAGELDRGAVGRRSGRGEQHSRQIAGGQFGQLAGQRDGRPIRVPARRERQLLQLLDDGRDDPGVAVPDLVDGVAVEIQIASTGGVGDPDALGSIEHVEAGRG